jgi:hypothetical protein
MAQPNGRSLAGTAGSNPARGMHVSLSLVSVVEEISATGRSIVQRCPNECCVPSRVLSRNLNYEKT